MIKWHCKSAEKRYLTNSTIGYIEGVKIYQIVWYRNSPTQHYKLYRNGIDLGDHYSICEAIEIAEAREYLRGQRVYRKLNDKVRI
jgi:hypothetical protein